MELILSAMRLLLILVVSVTFSSCKRSEFTGDTQTPEEYVMVATNIDLPYWSEARRGFEDAARELGVKARFLGTRTYNPTEQAQILSNAASSQPAGILVAPSDPDVLKGPIDAAMHHGLSVGCVDTDSPASGRLFFIGTSNYEAGVRGGEMLAKALNGSGRVILLTISRQWNLEERVRGYMDALKNYSQIKVAAILNDSGDPGKASVLVTEALHKYRDLKGIAGLDAASGPGAAEALEKKGKAGQVVIVAMDKDRPTLDYVRTGVIWATIAQKTHTMSYYGLKLLHDLRRNSVRIFPDWRLAQVSPLPVHVDTGVAVITRENVASFLQ